MSYLFVHPFPFLGRHECCGCWYRASEPGDIFWKGRYKYISFHFANLAIAMHFTEEAGEQRLWRRNLWRWELRVRGSVPEEIPRSGSCKSFSFVIPAILMKEVVNGVFEEGSSEDERTEPPSEVNNFPTLVNNKQKGQCALKKKVSLRTKRQKWTTT